MTVKQNVLEQCSPYDDRVIHPVVIISHYLTQPTLQCVTVISITQTHTQAQTHTHTTNYNTLLTYKENKLD